MLPRVITKCEDIPEEYAHLRKLCEENPRYREAWISGGKWIGRNGPLGLGDMIEVGLNKVGITKQRVAKWTGRPCTGCGRRQRWWNKAGRKIGIGT